MSTYLLINAAIIIVPLILSFESKIRFYRNLPYVLLSLLSVGTLYITWDIYAASEGHWEFNSIHTGSGELFGLPFEELLFFVTVPYAMLFLFEVFKYYAGSRFKGNIDISLTAPVIFLILTTFALIFSHHTYTLLALLSCALFFLVLFLAGHQFNHIFYGVFILFSYIPFFAVNYLLTSLPVVTYNPEVITGFRILTIPVEDFFYSFSLISLYLIVYEKGKNIASLKNII